MTLIGQGLTLQEFLDLPEEKPALEYVDSEVRQKVAPRPSHSALQVRFAVYLETRLEPTRQARVFTELRTTFAGASHVPDLVVYRWDRVPRESAHRFAREARTPPDLAVEILSLGQSLRELIATCQWYVDNGVSIALLVDDRDETMRVFRPGTAPSTYRRGDQVDLAAIAPGLLLDVDAIFSALDAG
jgi:Uma2 family endonuclease